MRKTLVIGVVIALLMLFITTTTPSAEAAAAATHDQVEVRPGGSLTSPGGQYRLLHQDDGNLVFYGPQGVIWHTGTTGRDTSHLLFQPDGNLVLYGEGQVLWQSATYREGNVLALQSDGNLVIYGEDGAVWAVKGITPPLDQRGSTTDGCGGWEHTISHYFGWETTRACRVMMCESGGYPYADNPRSSASGLFQFLDSTWRSTTGKPGPAKAYSPSYQTWAAKRLRDTGGWGHWVCK